MISCTCIVVPNSHCSYPHCLSFTAFRNGAMIAPPLYTKEALAAKAAAEKKAAEKAAALLAAEKAARAEEAAKAAQKGVDAQKGADIQKGAGKEKVVSEAVSRPMSPENGDWDGFPWDDIEVRAHPDHPM